MREKGGRHVRGYITRMNMSASRREDQTNDGWSSTLEKDNSL